MSFDVGDVVVLDFTVKVGTTLTDATVTLTITPPGSDPEDAGFSHVSTGTYTATYLIPAEGAYAYRWEASGAATAVESGTFYVRRSGSEIISINEVKDRLDKTLAVDDDEIASMLDAAIAEYEQYVGPVSGTVVEKHHGGRATIILRSPNVASISEAVYSDGTVIDVTDLDLNTSTGIVGWGYNTAGWFVSGTRNVMITYSVGAVPANHREAIIADVAGYFAATQRGPDSMPGDGYEAGWTANPMVLFPRIRKLAGPAIA